MATPVTDALRGEILAAFASQDSVDVVSKRLGVGRDRVSAIWKLEYGAEAIRARGNQLRGKGALVGANSEKPEVKAQALQAFPTGEALKAVALRLGVHYLKVREWWVEEFGPEKTRHRFKELHSQRAKEAGAERQGKPQRVTEEDYTCVGCGVSFRATRGSFAKRKGRCDKCCGRKEMCCPTPCPFCGVTCEGPRGVATHIRHQHPDQSPKELLFEGKREDEDYVVCRVCSSKKLTLGTHLRTHGLTAKQYLATYPGALIRSRVLTEKRSIAFREARLRAPRSEKKRISCPECGAVHEVSLFFAFDVHDARCEGCKAAGVLAETDARWLGKGEPEDFVTCRACGHRAENLNSHLQSVHPELVGRYVEAYPEALVIALRSAVRDKTALKGRHISEETRAKMSANAGRWNAGLTTETHPSVAAAAARMKGRPSWNQGLTKETHPSLRSTSELLKEYVGDKRPWKEKLRIPFTRSMFERHVMPNGKVSVGRAMADFGHCFPTIKKACVKLGLKVHRANVSQGYVLMEISKLLGGAAFEEEWNDPRFVNPETGRRVRFDGFFSTVGLVVEFHGRQHWTFPNSFLRYEELRPEWESMLRRDRLKQEMIEQTPGLKFLCIREDEPFDDLEHLRTRLREVGVGV